MKGMGGGKALASMGVLLPIGLGFCWGLVPFVYQQ